jgi:two-component system NtrC family response regulator
MAHVLIIDRQGKTNESLDHYLEELGHTVAHSETLSQGLRKVSTEKFDVVFMNPRMPDGNGLEFLPRFQEAPSSPEVIVVTESSDPDEAEQAIKQGAWDYVERSANVKSMAFPVIRAVQYRAKKFPQTPYPALRRETFTEIIGNSPQMKTCMDLLAQAAESDANVLITGETGTGKELFAWAIHANSARAEKNFVVVDCASLPETLVESTLFGYERGAYTGAEKSHSGLIKQADGGTLFLDEIGELPFSIQSAFLRVLQEKRFRPVGGTHEEDSDFRLIAATNQNLPQRADRGEFRRDLLFRIQTLTIELPPLRNRLEDIKYLALFHMSQICERYHIEIKEFSPEFLDVLHRYPWPGNVRELVNALERAIITARNEPVLFPKHLPTHIHAQAARSFAGINGLQKFASTESLVSGKSFPKLKDLRIEAISEIERKYLKDLFSMTQGDIKEALRISGLSRSRLYGLLKKYGISSS